MKQSAIKLAVTDERESFLGIPIDAIRSDAGSLPFPIYLKVADNYVLFRVPQGELTRGRLDRLGQKIEILYVPNDHWIDLLRHFEEETAKCEKGKLLTSQLESVRTLLHAHWEHMLGCHEIYAPTFAKIRDLTNQFAILIPNLKSAEGLIRRYKDDRLYFSAHNVNVAVYSLAIAREIGLGTTDLQLLALGTLLHNVGYLTLPANTVSREPNLSQQDKLELRAHAIRGSDMLTKLDPGEPEIALVALQHHERCDGTGYPAGLTSNEIHFYAQICGLSDRYDELMSGFSRNEAVAQIKSEARGFDPTLLEVLLKLGY